MSILLTLFVIGFLIFVHELGHFMVAKLFKVHVETFSIGFGPKLFSFQKKETTYKLSIIPIGGYIRMKQDEAEETETTYEEGSFQSKTWYQRSLIVLAGPIFNLILATILIIATLLIGRTYNDFYPIVEYAEYPYNEYFQKGDVITQVNNVKVNTFTDIYRNLKENEENVFLVERNSESVQSLSVNISSEIPFILYPSTTNLVGDVSVGLPAWKAGVRTGDKIIKIDEKETNTWNDIREAIITSKNESIVLSIERDGVFQEISVYPEINSLLDNDDSSGDLRSPHQHKIIGITQHFDLTFTDNYNLYDSIKYGVVTTINFVYLNYKAIFTLFQNPALFKNNVGGPIMIHYLTSQATQLGISSTLYFMAAISIMLMIMNLLPIPVFDGGHFMFFLYEGIFRRPIPIKIQMFLQQIGIFILISLMVYAFYSDIMRFWR